MAIKIVFLLVVVVFVGVATTCEPIKIKLCQQHLGYNYTEMPNFAGHALQADASIEVTPTQSC